MTAGQRGVRMHNPRFLMNGFAPIPDFASKIIPVVFDVTLLMNSDWSGSFDNS